MARQRNYGYAQVFFMGDVPSPESQDIFGQIFANSIYGFSCGVYESRHSKPYNPDGLAPTVQPVKIVDLDTPIFSILCRIVLPDDFEPIVGAFILDYAAPDEEIQQHLWNVIDLYGGSIGTLGDMFFSNLQENLKEAMVKKDIPFNILSHIFSPSPEILNHWNKMIDVVPSLKLVVDNTK